MPIPSNSNIITDTGQISDGVIRTADIADTQVTAAKMAGGTNGDVLGWSGGVAVWAPPASIPAGTVLPYAGSAAPTGYLLADGTAVNRTTYASLFTAISTVFGVGDGSTTFNLPDLRGRIPVGKNAATFAALGGTGGEETHVLTASEIPAHTHGFNTSQNGTGGAYGYAQATATNSSAAVVQTAANTGDAAHNNLQPYITLNYIIKT